MTDREKVISGLMHHRERCSINGDICPYFIDQDECVRKLCDDVLKLVKAQDPVLPVFTLEMADITSDLEKIAYCGNCSHKLGRLRVNYCEHCGRAVKWMQMN